MVPELSLQEATSDTLPIVRGRSLELRASDFDHVGITLQRSTSVVRQTVSNPHRKS
jgi:hypothetical protein